MAEAMLKGSYKFKPTLEDSIHMEYLNDKDESINSPKRIKLANMHKMKPFP